MYISKEAVKNIRQRINLAYPKRRGWKISVRRSSTGGAVDISILQAPREGFDFKTHGRHSQCVPAYSVIGVEENNYVTERNKPAADVLTNIAWIACADNDGHIVNIELGREQNALVYQS